jgi:hypothetical protein
VAKFQDSFGAQAAILEGKFGEPEMQFVASGLGLWKGRRLACELPAGLEKGQGEYAFLVAVLMVLVADRRVPIEALEEVGGLLEEGGPKADLAPLLGGGFEACPVTGLALKGAGVLEGVDGGNDGQEERRSG